MSNDNSGQIEFWNGEHGESWARYSAIVDHMFSELTDAVLDAAEIRPGDRILDIGCGGGGLSMAAAQRTTAIGTVTGIDVSGPMLDRAQDRADEAGLVNVVFVLGDASIYPFAEMSFDAAISRLGVMFFDAPEEAFRRVAGSFSTGARVAFGVWREPRENPWAMEPVSAAKPFIDMPPRPGPEDPGPFSFANPDRVRRILEGAGLEDVRLAPFDFAIPLGRDLDEALAFAMEMGPLSKPLGEVTGANRDKAIAAIRDVLSGHRDDDGTIRLGGACWIVTARAP